MYGNHLMEIIRYPNKIKHNSRSVAEHSWFVAKIAHGLALWEKNKFFQEDVDVEKVMFLAINHDIVESYTGDIISTTKNLSPTLRMELERVESIIFHTHIIKTIPESWGSMYIDLHEEMSKLESINSKLVKAGDLLDRVFECMEEIKLANKETFEEILVRDIERLFELDLYSVNYFLKYSIKDVGAYEYIPKEIREELELMDFSKYF